MVIFFFVGNKYPMDILQKNRGTTDSPSPQLKKVRGTVPPLQLRPCRLRHMLEKIMLFIRKMKCLEMK